MDEPITNGTSQSNDVEHDVGKEASKMSKPEIQRINKPIGSSFAEMRTGFFEEVSRYLMAPNLDRIKHKWNSFQAKDITKRVSLEQALRDKAVAILRKKQKKNDDLVKLFETVMVFCKNELVTVILSVTILNDVIDTSTLDVCEKLFDFVELNLSTWKSQPFFTSCKNNILRMCNDLLRRLSKTQNTIFCGRVLIFLAMFFPFSERSGLNIVSEFNTDNISKYDVKANDNDESMEVVDVTMRLDNNFYSKFWSLQEFFRNPTQCYNKTQWKDFVDTTKLVLTVLKKCRPDRDSVDRLSGGYEGRFYTKFLTSHKLLLLQLSDSSFRRIICLQFLILFQYLTSQIKTKLDTHELSSDEMDWTKESAETVYTIIRETPPDGENFLTIARNMIQREDDWSAWKNEGCPAVKRTAEANSITPKSTLEDSLGQNSFSVLTAQSATGIDTIFVPSSSGPPQAMSLKHSFDEYIACLTPAPELKDFLTEAIEESEMKIEPEKKKVADPSFAWLSVKLISLKAPTFFSNSHSGVPSMSEYVDIMCKKLYRDLNPGLLLPPIMPAPKSASAKGKKITPKPNAAAALQKKLKRPKSETEDSGTVVKMVKGGTVKLVKTSKGVRVVKEEGNRGSSPPEDEKTSGDRTSGAKPLVKTSSSVSDEKKKVEKSSSDKVSNDRPEKGFAKPSPPISNSKNDKHKSEKEPSPNARKSPSPKPKDKKLDDRIKKDDKRNERDDRRADREEKKDRRTEKRDKSPKERTGGSESRPSSERSRERERSGERGKAAAAGVRKSPGKRKASPKREETKASKVIRVEDVSDGKKTEDLTRDQIHDLAKSIAENWKKVAEKLGYKPDEIEYFETQENSDYNRALKLLVVWVDEEDATKETLRRHLKTLGLSQAVSVLGR